MVVTTSNSHFENCQVKVEVIVEKQGLHNREAFFVLSMKLFLFLREIYPRILLKRHEIFWLSFESFLLNDESFLLARRPFSFTRKPVLICIDVF